MNSCESGTTAEFLAPKLRSYHYLESDYTTTTSAGLRCESSSAAEAVARLDVVELGKLRVHVMLIFWPK